MSRCWLHLVCRHSAIAVPDSSLLLAGEQFPDWGAANPPVLRRDDRRAIRCNGRFRGAAQYRVSIQPL